MSFLGKIRRSFCALFVVLLGCAGFARASATLLLEEPYGKLGFFTATGHAAVYLSGVCAATPVKLRRCAPGELGIVISRYDGVGGYDWVAVPLIPYLYAVDRPEDIPLFVDSKMVNFLRDQYRRNYLEDVAPDLPEGRTPGGNWYELVGSAYDRAAYGFQIETTPAQDAAFIRKYNSSPNRSHFHITYRNCADFAKDAINFYFPKALHRSVVADIGISTPKQMAKMLIKFSQRHDGLQFTRFVIPQIPGSQARSTPVHGVVESFLKSKKYIVPSAIASPVFAGCVVAVYFGTGAGRFDPARQALVFNAERNLESPIGDEDRRAYQTGLKHLGNNPAEEIGPASEKLGRLLRNATADLDMEGRPVFRIGSGEEIANVGAAPSNLFANGAPEPITLELLEARLRQELRRGSPPKVSESDVTRDWGLLQKALDRQTLDRQATDYPEAEMAERSRRPLQSSSPVRFDLTGNRP